LPGIDSLSPRMSGHPSSRSRRRGRFAEPFSPQPPAYRLKSVLRCSNAVSRRASGSLPVPKASWPPTAPNRARRTEANRGAYESGSQRERACGRSCGSPQRNALPFDSHRGNLLLRPTALSGLRIPAHASEPVRHAFTQRHIPVACRRCARPNVPAIMVGILGGVEHLREFPDVLVRLDAEGLPGRACEGPPQQRTDSLKRCVVQGTRLVSDQKEAAS